jgi:hypothetical protein
VKYTNKHQALAKHLSLTCTLIDNLDDVFFTCKPYDFLIVTDDEIKDFLVNEIDVVFELPFYEFSLDDVATVMEVEVEKIKEFFLPEIIIGEVNFHYNKIDSKVLLKYLENNRGASFFIENYANFLISQGRSGEILCNKKSNEKEDGYNIYWR